MTLLNATFYSFGFWDAYWFSEIKFSTSKAVGTNLRFNSLSSLEIAAGIFIHGCKSKIGTLQCPYLPMSPFPLPKK